MNKMVKESIKINEILSYLDELFPNPKCELNYNKDYELLIAICLSAQTTDKRVNKVTSILFNKYKTIENLANADISDIESIIRELGSYRKKSIYVKEIATKLLKDNILVIPNDREYLESFPGVGRKTVNVFLGMIYNEPTIAVDTHVERVSKRLGLANKNANVLEVEKSLQKKIPKEKLVKTHHELVLFGRYYCKAVKPLCNNCKLVSICKYKEKTR